MGSVGNCLKQRFYGEIHSSTNKVDVEKYFLSLKDQLSTNCRPWLVLDNAAAHHAHSVKKVLKRYFRPLFLPAYSCQFNSVELLWALLKRKVVSAHTNLMFRREANVEHMRALVQLTCDDEIGLDVYTNLLGANRKYLNSFLNEREQIKSPLRIY